MIQKPLISRLDLMVSRNRLVVARRRRLLARGTRPGGRFVLLGLRCRLRRRLRRLRSLIAVLWSRGGEVVGGAALLVWELAAGGGGLLQRAVSGARGRAGVVVGYASALGVLLRGFVVDLRVERDDILADVLVAGNGGVANWTGESYPGVQETGKVAEAAESDVDERVAATYSALHPNCREIVRKRVACCCLAGGKRTSNGREQDGEQDEEEVCAVAHGGRVWRYSKRGCGGCEVGRGVQGGSLWDRGVLYKRDVGC